MQDTEISLTRVANLFRQLPTPTESLPRGDYRAEITGPLWLRKTARPLLASIGFSNWYGKRILDNSSAINLKDDAENRTEFLPMLLAIEPSRLDGKPAWVLRYPPSTHFPVRNMADEIRPLEGASLLGISYTELPGMGKIGLPFLLHRQS